MGMSHSFSPDDNKGKLFWPRQRTAQNRNSDGDDDAEENEDVHIVPERLSVASLASLTDPDERLAALQKHLNETQRRNAEVEKHLQDDLAAREQEIVDLLAKLDRRSEDLSIKTREEKELRIKEVLLAPSPRFPNNDTSGN
jgi:seryl-tRNA synthetase